MSKPAGIAAQKPEIKSSSHDQNQSDNLSSADPKLKSLLIDFSHEDEPDITISSFPQSASISEIWGPYPYKPKCQVDWDNQISQISSQVAELNPYIKHKLPGEEIAASRIWSKMLLWRLSSC